MNFKATIEITPQQIADLMVAAFEGGINGWCGSAYLSSPKPTPTPDEEGTPWYSWPAVWAGDFLVVFGDAEEEDTWTMTREKVQCALANAVSPHDIALITAGDDGDVLDADDADRIIQKLLFGEVVFG